MYYGEAATKVDDKGRITIPSKVRDTMRNRRHFIWYMTRGYNHSIFLFPEDAWTKIRAQAAQRSPMDARSIAFRRLFFSSVAEAETDNQGRMPVPQNLREFAKIDKDAVLIGVDDHMELWDKDTWKTFQNQHDSGYEEMAASLFSSSGAGEAATEKGGHEHEDRAE